MRVKSEVVSSLHADLVKATAKGLLMPRPDPDFLVIDTGGSRCVGSYTCNHSRRVST